MKNTASADYELLTLRSPEDIETWRKAFGTVYREIFSEEPYHEQFSQHEAEQIYNSLVSTPKAIIVLAIQNHALIGFSAAVPLQYRPDISCELTGLIPIRHTYYLAELAVVPSARHSGLGRKLIFERLRQMDHVAFSHAVMRVSHNDRHAKALYIGLGFSDMGVYMEVPNLRVDGGMRDDRRLFLSKLLSQVDHE